MRRRERVSADRTGHGAEGTKSQTLKLRDGHALKDKTRNLRTALERKGLAAPVYLMRVAAVKGV